MKHLHLKSLLVIGIILIAAHSCFDEKYDPDEILITLNAPGYLNEDHAMYMIVENEESAALSLTAVEGLNTIIRGENFTGTTFNVHIITTYKVFNEVNVYSYIGISPGKEINFLNTDDETKKSEYVNIANISFTDIPDFDVATRAAMHSRHVHTSDSLGVPCAPIGGNTFEVGDKFYVCLEKDGDAGYVFPEVPDVDDFEISLANLNTDMTKYSFLKTFCGEQSISVVGHANEEFYQIFNLDATNFAIFPGDNIDIFVPTGLQEMTSFTTKGSILGTDHRYYNSHNGDEVVMDDNILLTLATIERKSGQAPVITAEDVNYDGCMIELYIEPYKDKVWTIFSEDGKDLEFPQIPESILESLGEDIDLSTFVSDSSYVYCTYYEDSRLDGYDDYIDLQLESRSFSESNYSTKQEVTRLLK